MIKVFDLVFDTKYYYIKRNKIVEKIPFNHRTFYAKFERIDEDFTPLVFAQHLAKDYTIALPLVKNNRSHYLVIEYKGEESQRFYYLIQHLFKSLHILDYHLYQGKDEKRLQVFIEVKNITLAEADETLLEISHALKQKMPMAWKCLPSSTLPEAYNIVTLPYHKI